jgi:hypothetical protein
MCFVLLITCVILIANGPVGGVVFYENDVQARCIKNKLITAKNIKKRFALTSIALFVPYFTAVPFMVYYINGATDFWTAFWQMSIILWIQNVFDRLFIDWYWVNHTKAWDIPGTEDLKPYIPKKVLIGKWLGTILLPPIIAAMNAGIAILFM